MLYRLMRDWRGYRVGKVFEPPANVASILLRRGLIAPAEQEDAKTDKGKKKKSKG